MKKVYEGYIGKNEYGFLTVDDEVLSCNVVDDLKDIIDKDVFIRYYITNKPHTEEKAKEKLIEKISGKLDAEYELDAYSEWTVLEWKQELWIGDHDLMSELEKYEGKYLVLIIESKL